MWTWWQAKIYILIRGGKYCACDGMVGVFSSETVNAHLYFDPLKCTQKCLVEKRPVIVIRINVVIIHENPGPYTASMNQGKIWTLVICYILIPPKTIWQNTDSWLLLTFAIAAKRSQGERILSEHLPHKNLQNFTQKRKITGNYVDYISE